MTDRTYEQAVAEHWPKDRLPAHEGTRCPPFRATLYRLAESLANNRPLTPQLQQVHEHLDECGACRSTVSAVTSRLTAAPAEPTSSVIGDVSWEGTPLRRLRDHATRKVYLPNETLKDVFAAVCFAANLTEAEAFEAVGWPEKGRQWLKECAEIAIFLLSDLGVERSVLERAIECPSTNAHTGPKPVVNRFDTDSNRQREKHVLPPIIAPKHAGPPHETE